METSNANPFCWATAKSLSTISATTDSGGAGEAVASKVGAGEREGGRNVPELKQDLRHIEAEQGNRVIKTGSGCDCRVSGTTIRRRGRTIRSGAGMGRMRVGTLEARSQGGSPEPMSPVAVPCSNSCSVPKCNNDLIICLFFLD